MTRRPSPAQLEQLVEEDWSLDSGGEPSMPLERFKDALFEMADTWTEEAEPKEYAPAAQPSSALIDGISNVTIFNYLSIISVFNIIN